ncbi:MAG TPA: cytochrome c3 family protein [Blastocatellia bacterium]|nr:cytochrome c3 family protein [Blastocatellia bacterium]
MTLTIANKKSLAAMVLLLWFCVVAAAIFRGTSQAASANADTCIACHSRDQLVSLYQTSTHGKMSIGCEGCHGGDSSQTEKAKAHAGQFVARPDTAATLEMCGKCHSQPLEFFKSSRHVAARPNAARLDCVECHGVHAIGAASESFRWPQFCASCHGLEYLPQLPKPFQEMLSMIDELNDGMHRLESKARVDAELIQRRKEIRHMISELVHRTDSKGGVERIPHILELEISLKRKITADGNR